MKRSFIGQKLLVITAHPDDESYLVAGTLFKNYKSGGSNFLICATYGEKGKSHLKKVVTGDHLKKIRQKELQKVSNLLHINPVHFLNLPDGKLSKHSKKMYDSSLKYAKKIKPDTILGFGNDGITGHHDHINIGKVSMKLAKHLKIPYYAFCLPPKVTKNALKWLIQKRNAKHYTKKINFNNPKYRIKINSNIKKRALRCHASQMEGYNVFTGYPDYTVKALLDAEYFC